MATVRRGQIRGGLRQIKGMLKTGFPVGPTAAFFAVFRQFFACFTGLFKFL
jgi:hypothetical protein